MSPGTVDQALVRRHLLALDAALLNDRLDDFAAFASHVDAFLTRG